MRTELALAELDQVRGLLDDLALLPIDTIDGLRDIIDGIGSLFEGGFSAFSIHSVTATGTNDLSVEINLSDRFRELAVALIAGYRDLEIIKGRH